MPDRHNDISRSADRAAARTYLENFRLVWFTPIQLSNALFEHLSRRPDYIELERWLHQNAEAGLFERSADGRSYRAGPMSDSLQEFAEKLAAANDVQLNREQAAKLRAWLAGPNGSCILGSRLTVEAVEGGGLLVRTRAWTAVH